MLSNRDLLEDFNFRMESLLHKLMELTPKTQANIPEINKKLRDFYLNGSKNISELNSQGLVNVTTLPSYEVYVLTMHTNDYLMNFFIIFTDDH